MQQTNFTDERKDTEKHLAKIHTNRLPLIFILDKLTDVGNIAMIFRIADALRIEKILLYDYDFPVSEKKLRKLSRSTEKYVTYEYADITAVEKLAQTHQLIALDKTINSINYSEFKPQKPIALIIGSERFGISEALLKLPDIAIHLPMNGINTSINVATATSVAAYHIAQTI